MKILFIIAFYLLYWFICYINTGTDKKNLVGLRSYPDSVQRVVRARRDLGKEIPPEKSIATMFLSNLMMFTVVFSLLGLLLKDTLGLTDFLTAFWFFLIEVIKAFGKTQSSYDRFVTAAKEGAWIYASLPWVGRSDTSI